MDETLKNSIDELHSHIVQTSNQMNIQIIQSKYVEPKMANEIVLFGKQLVKLLPKVSQPGWLHELISEFDGKNFYTGRSDSYAPEFAQFMLANIYDIEKQILTPDEVNYDFDLAFDTAREEQEIPQIFENLVVKLEEIIAADVVDSRVVQQALERLKTLLKRNKKGSLASVLVSMHYGRFTIKAFSGVLAANKYLKPMLEAFKEEFAEAETKVQNAESTLKEQAIRRLTNEERLKTYLDQTDAGSSAVSGFLTFDDTEADTDTSK